MLEIKPFIKWAGGKTQLLDEIKKRLPDKYNDYYEPFVGGGAVLFGIQPQNSFINDINNQLINVYIQLKDHPEDVITFIKNLDAIICNKEFYCLTRDAFNDKIKNNILDVEAAGLFIFMNKHCFNGLYRVNSKGFFNVPWNKKTSVKSIDEKNLINISSFLKSVSISNIDFEEFCNSVNKNDFVYFDSPYVPEGETANFVSYTKDGFSLKDHKRLAELYKHLDERGAKLMLSNNDVELVHKLYKDYNISSFNVKRMINREADKRTGKEVLITNY